MLDNHVQGMNDTGNKAQQGQQDVQPEMAFEANLQEHAEWREQDGKKNFDRIGRSDGHGEYLRMKWIAVWQIEAGRRPCLYGIA